MTSVTNLAKQAVMKGLTSGLQKSMKPQQLQTAAKLTSPSLRHMSSGLSSRQRMLSLQAKENRSNLADWFSAFKTGAQAWHDNTGMSTEYTNLMAPTKLVRHDSDPTSSETPTIDHQTTKKAHLDPETGSLHPSGKGPHGLSSDPYGSLAAQQVMDHIRGKDKNESPLISTTLADEESLTDLTEFGDKIEIESDKADVKPTKLAVAELLFNELEDDGVKLWDWRKDPMLALKSEKDVEALEDKMALFGIDPGSKLFSRSEKMAVFALSTNEHLIVGPTQDGAAKLTVTDPEK